MTKIEAFIEKSKKHLEDCCCVEKDAELHEQAIEQIEALRKELETVSLAHNEWAALYLKAVAGNEQLATERDEYREALGMVDHVGMHEPYDRIVREVLAKYPKGKSD